MRNLVGVAVAGTLTTLVTAGCTGGPWASTSSPGAGAAIATTAQPVRQAGEPTTPAGGSTPPAAEPTPEAGAPGPPAGGPTISAGEAETIALQTVGSGEVVRIDAEDDDGVLRVWEVTVVTPAGEREITIDRTTGSVLRDELDD